MTIPRTIKRLLDNGEAMRPTDRMLNTKFKWVERGKEAEGDVKQSHHHPTYREERVLLEGELTRDQFAAAALTGLCSSQETIGKAMKMIAGGQQFEITDVTAQLACLFADSMIRAREGHK